MKTLEELLAEWEDGTLTPEDARELKRRLATPEARRQLVDDWLFYEAVYGALQAKQAMQPEPTAAKPVAGSLWQLVRHYLQPAWRWAAAGAAVFLLAALGVWFYSQNTPAALLVALEGEVTVAKGGNSEPAKAGQTIYPRSVISVPNTGRALLVWQNESTQLELGPGAQLQIVSRLRGKKFILGTGSLTASVAPQRGLGPMIVRTPLAELVVKGTRFSVKVEQESTRLAVLEGLVAMRKLDEGDDDGTDYLAIGPGQEATAGANRELKAETLTGLARREILSFPAGNDTLEAGTGRLEWSSYIDSLTTAGWPFGPERDAGKACAERIRCYLEVPASGDYVFWIQSRRRSELWLSLDDQPGNCRKIAGVQSSEEVGPSGWVPFPTGNATPIGGAQAGALASTAPNAAPAGNRSDKQTLAAGKRYYLEVLHELDERDSLAVGWIRPDANARSIIEIIGGKVLVPWLGEARSADLEQSR